MPLKKAPAPKPKKKATKSQARREKIQKDPSKMSEKQRQDIIIKRVKELMKDEKFGVIAFSLNQKGGDGVAECCVYLKEVCPNHQLGGVFGKLIDNITQGNPMLKHKFMMDMLDGKIQDCPDKR